MNKLKSVVIALVIIICTNAVLSVKADSFPPGNSGSSDSDSTSSGSSESDTNVESDD